jgi:hypothetical protein
MSNVIQRAPARNSYLPRNGRHAAAVQQFNENVRLVTVSPNDAPGHFSATVNGELVVISSRTPFLDAARVILDRGVDSNSWLILRHQGSDTECLRGKVGLLAKLTVKEPDRGRLRLSRWDAFPSRPVTPPMRETALSAVTGSGAEILR